MSTTVEWNDVSSRNQGVANWQQSFIDDVFYPQNSDACDVTLTSDQNERLAPVKTAEDVIEVGYVWFQCRPI